uniref:Putative secreted peptide n=1 Tax=Anopheles braziliensis TaxID=58242 RepID=A0A2M3ZP71_9DIPT
MSRSLVWFTLVRPGRGSNAGMSAENWRFSTNSSSQDLPRLPAAARRFSSVSSSMNDSRLRDTITCSSVLPTSSYSSSFSSSSFSSSMSSSSSRSPSSVGARHCSRKSSSDTCSLSLDVDVRLIVSAGFSWFD